MNTGAGKKNCLHPYHIKPAFIFQMKPASAFHMQRGFGGFLA